MATKTQTTSYAEQSVLPDWYTNYAKDILAKQDAVAERPYTPYTEPRIAGFTPDQVDAFDMTRSVAGDYRVPLALGTLATAGALGSSASDSISPMLEKLGGINALGAAQGYLSSATGLQDRSMEYARPYFSMASGDATDVSAYEDPYIEHVLNRFSDLGARSLREKLMPELMNKYISAGQLGFGGTPTGLVTDSARALRDVHQSVNDQYLAALSDSYQKAREAKLADLTRYSNLASTAAGAGSAEYANKLQAQTNAARIAAEAETARQKNALDAAELKARTENEDAKLRLFAASQLGALGEQSQRLGLTGAGALGSIGTQQQNMQQQNLSLSYQDFLNQLNFPQQQINQQSATLGAVNPAVPTAKVGYQVAQTPTSGQPNTAQTLLSGMAAIKALGS